MRKTVTGAFSERGDDTYNDCWCQRTNRAASGRFYGCQWQRCSGVVAAAIDDLPANITQHIGPTNTWSVMIKGFDPDVAISCLGTTMRIAGSRNAFRAVDHDLVLAFAKAARDSGARHMISVSSVGAMPASSSFYLRTKAETEEGLRALKFERLDIIRPGLLTGGARLDSRPGEAIANMLSPLTDLLMVGSLSRYRSTPSEKVARAIAALVDHGGEGHFIHENDQINALAG